MNKETFLYMPKLDDSQKNLSFQSPLEIDTNTKRLLNIARINNLIRKKNLKDSLSIELYENDDETYYVCYLVKNSEGIRTIVGEVDAYEKNYRFPSVGMSYILSGYEGKGYSILLYKTLINYLGGLVSDDRLTGKEGHGSINVWKSLGRDFNSYIIPSNPNNLKLKEVGIFDKNMATTEENRFMVTVDDIDWMYSNN